MYIILFCDAKKEFYSSVLATASFSKFLEYEQIENGRS